MFSIHTYFFPLCFKSVANNIRHMHFNTAFFLHCWTFGTRRLCSNYEFLGLLYTFMHVRKGLYFCFYVELTVYMCIQWNRREWLQSHLLHILVEAGPCLSPPTPLRDLLLALQSWSLQSAKQLPTHLLTHTDLHLQIKHLNILTAY